MAPAPGSPRLESVPPARLPYCRLWQQTHPAPNSRIPPSPHSATRPSPPTAAPHRPTPKAQAPRQKVIAVGRTWKIRAGDQGLAIVSYRMSPTLPSPEPQAPHPYAMRLGIFGGSFDPVHNGHLELARCCQRQAALDEVWFTPTAIQPLKHAGPQATNQQRLEMLQLGNRTRTSLPRLHARNRPRRLQLHCRHACGKFTSNCPTPSFFS